MLRLYHGANSVCSVKVRVVLAEKNLAWESHHINLPKGEQFEPEFLKINPRSIVPVLDHDGVLIHESSVISEYLDGLSEHNKLMPSDLVRQAKTRRWGVYTLEYHDSVNTLTFSSYQRKMLLEKPPEELEARWAAMPDQIRVRKIKDLLANGGQSAHVPVAMKRLARMCAEMEDDLATGPWLMGESYSLADALLTAYFFRTECVGLAGLWESRYPRTTDWYERIKARGSFGEAINPWLDEAAMGKIKAAGEETFLADDSYADFLKN